MNELSALFAAAREAVAQLTINPLCTYDHAQRLVREDALAILDKLQSDVMVRLNAPTDYLKPEGE